MQNSEWTTRPESFSQSNLIGIETNGKLAKNIKLTNSQSNLIGIETTRTGKGNSARHLSIEPYWNWNTWICTITTIASKLSIEPYWNWNSEIRRARKSTGILSIEPYWNWNQMAAKAFLPQSFSQSNLIGIETWLRSIVSDIKGLSIEPYWNWNRGRDGPLSFARLCTKKSQPAA